MHSLTLRDLARRPFGRFLDTLCAAHSRRHKAWNVTLWLRCPIGVDPDRATSVSEAHQTLRYAHETNDCSLQQQYDQPMAAVDEQQLERALAEAIVHGLCRRDKTEP